MAQLPPDFKEFIELLNAHDVRYLVVGGYAVAYHGHPRATGDIDIYIAATEANARNSKPCSRRSASGVSA